MPPVIEYGTEYSVDIYQSIDNASRLAVMDRVVDLRYVLNVNDLGGFALTLPDDFDQGLLDKDRVIRINRRPANGSLYCDFTGLLMFIDLATGETGLNTDQIGGPCLNELLRRRIVAYAAASAQASKTGNADNLMKAVVTENLGSSAATYRQWAASLSVQGDASLGQSLSKAFSRQNVLSTLQGLVEASRNLGTDIYFGIVPTSNTAYEFQTKSGQWGNDRTQTTGKNPLTFGLEYGNLLNPHYTLDWSEYANVVYAGGQGLESNRSVQEVYDSDGLIYQKRTEAFVNSVQSTTTAALTAEANAGLIDRRVQKKFTATITNAPGTIYGVDWRLGDKVTATYRGMQFDCMIRQVSVEVSDSKYETITAALESYQTL